MMRSRYQNGKYYVGKINPWTVLALKRKLKKYDKIGMYEAMKVLLRAREMNIESKMLIVTEIPRTLQWVIRKTMDFGEDLEKRKLNKMARLLMKEWKIKLGIKYADKDKAQPYNKIQSEAKNGQSQ